MTPKDLEIALTLIVFCTAAAFALRYFTGYGTSTRKKRFSLLIVAASLGATALIYQRDTATAAAPAACEATEPAAQPAEPPDPLDVYHLRQRVCWSSTGTARG